MPKVIDNMKSLSKYSIDILEFSFEKKVRSCSCPFLLRRFWAGLSGRLAVPNRRTELRKAFALVGGEICPKYPVGLA